MPPVVAVGVTLAATAVGGKGGSTGGGSVLGQIITLVVANALSRKLSDRKSSAGTPLRQREVTVRATDAFETFVYGRAMVGGLTVYQNATTGPGGGGVNNHMFHVVKWTGHRVNCLQLFRFDDQTLDPSVDSVSWNPVTYAGSGHVQTGSFSGNNAYPSPTRLRWYAGNQSSADTPAVALLSDWTVDHIGKERAYGVLEIVQVDENNQTENVFQSGFPSNIQALVHGKSVYDPRRYSLNYDPNFTNISSEWATGTNSADYSAASSLYAYRRGIGGPSDDGAHLEADASIGALLTRPIAVSASGLYAVTMRVRQPAGARTTRLAVAFWDGDGNNIPISSDSTPGWTYTGSFRYFGLNNTTAPAIWTEFTVNLGSGYASIPNCASFVRIGVDGFVGGTGTSQLQLQDVRIRNTINSSQLVDVASTWGYSENPSLCAADYLRNEQFGFGKESRLPVNPTRYARNTDAGFRRMGTMTNTRHWYNATGNTPLNASPDVFSLSLALDSTAGVRGMVISDAGSSEQYLFSGEGVPCDPEGHYVVHARMRQLTGNRKSALYITFLNSGGTTISAASPFAFSALSSVWSNYTFAVGSGTGIAIPSSARFMRWSLYAVNSTASPTTTQVAVQEAIVMPGTTVRRFVEPYEHIYWPSVAVTAAYCDTPVSTPSGTQVRFAANGAGSTGSTYRDNLRDILSAGNLILTFTQSGFNILGGWEEPDVVIRRNDMAGPISLKGADTRDRYNHVRGTFYDQHQDYKLVPFATVNAAEYIARDNSMHLYEDLSLPFTNDWFMAQRVAFGTLEQGDNQLTAEMPLKHSQFALAIGKHVSVSLGVTSWTQQSFIITGLSGDARRGMSAVLREDYAASYTDPSTGEYIPRSGSAITGYVPFVPQVGSVTATAINGGVRLKWANPSNRSFEWVRVYKALLLNTFNSSQLVKRTKDTEFTDVYDGHQGLSYYWLQTEDFAGNVSSVYPAATNTTLYGMPLFTQYPDPENYFMEEFRYADINQFHQAWTPVGSSWDSGITFPQSGNFGGQALAVSSTFAYYVSKKRLPYDPLAIYQMLARVTLVRSHANRQIYFGFVGYRADGVTPIQTNSDEGTGGHWFAANARTVNSNEIVSGFMRGNMAWPNSGSLSQDRAPSDPHLAARMHDLVRYVAPAFAVNYTGGYGEVRVNGITVAKRSDQGNELVWDPDVNVRDNWIYLSTDSMDIIDGLRVSSSFNDVSSWRWFDTVVASEYSTMQLYDAGPSFVEKYRPDFHRNLPIMTASASLAITSTLRLYCSTSGGAASVVPVYRLYTRNGSLCGGGSGPALVSGTSYWPNQKWAEVTVPIYNVHSAYFFVNQTSFPPPYFITLGARATVESNDVYLGGLRGALLVNSL